MNMPWYCVVEGTTSITQGDIIMGCPVAAWREVPITVTTDYSVPEEILNTFVEYLSIDTVVMTQACDLEQDKVQYVILCPHYAKDEHRRQWEIEMRQDSQNPTDKAWKS